MSAEKPEKIDPEKIRANLQHLKLVQAMIEDLPHLLVDARQDAKITQLELGSELGVKREQITADEGDKYQNAALHKMRRTLNATIKLLEKKINQ